VASDFAYQDYEETGNADSLTAATSLYNGAVQAYTAYTNGG
jgi:hypothetical protein